VRTTRRQILLAVALVGALAFTTTIARAADPLPSSNDDKAKQSIVGFVSILAVTLVVIMDMEYPRLGFVRVDSFDQVLVDLRRSMK